MARTRIRHRDVRLAVPQNPGVDADERTLAQGRYLEADCLLSDAAGDAVYFTGVPVAGQYQVTKCDPLTPATMPGVGIIEEKYTSTTCLVVVSGLYTTTGLTTGTQYWIDTDAQLTATAPDDPAFLQVAGVAASTTELLLKLPPTFQGLSKAQHDAIRSLAHLTEYGGPYEGFASGAYSETTRDGPFPLTEIWYTSAAKTHKIVAQGLTWVGPVVTVETWTVYDTDGSTALAQSSDAITYDDDVFEASRVRTITVY